MTKSIACLVLPFIAATAMTGVAQEPTRAASPQTHSSTQIPLKVQLVISRYIGEKKVSNIPFTLSVVANDKDKTSLRILWTCRTGHGFQRQYQSDKVSVPTTTSYNYRSIGTNIDCTAQTIEAGLFKLDLGVSDSSVFLNEKQGSGTAMPMTGVPAFRSFTSTFNVLLKDGQTAQHIAGPIQSAGKCCASM